MSPRWSSYRGLIWDFPTVEIGTGDSSQEIEKMSAVLGMGDDGDDGGRRQTSPPLSLSSPVILSHFTSALGGGVIQRQYMTATNVPHYQGGMEGLINVLPLFINI
ncbi:hypothetical protein ACP70R_014388 [Stipagrostis hirtigluma subsp. patula]